MDHKQLQTFINQEWDNKIIPSLCEYIKIPNKSPHFDSNWEENGYMEQAVNHIADWCNDHAPKGMNLEILKLAKRTPLIFIDIPGEGEENILLYGHLDKQPEMEGWDHDLSPWKPVIKNNRLYGRGAADDGYAAYAAITAINALQAQGLNHPRCVIIIEACEESGSYDLPYYIEHIKDKIGKPSLVICLDSGAGNYEQLWLTSSLRGIINGNLEVSLLTEGIHSGYGSGMIADSFRVARELIGRVENSKTGEITIPELYCEIPEKRIEEAKKCSEVLGKNIYSSLPMQDKVVPTTQSLDELILNRTWRPALTVVSADGLPSLQNGGNVLRPYTTFKLSFRVPPFIDVKKAELALEKALTENPPYGSKVSFKLDHTSIGWNAPIMPDKLENIVNEASMTFYQKPFICTGEGGTIPFMGMLGEKFPAAQFVITGVLGPNSNAHGPNEFLEIDMAKKLTCCVSYIIHRLS